MGVKYLIFVFFVLIIPWTYVGYSLLAPETPEIQAVFPVNKCIGLARENLNEENTAERNGGKEFEKLISEVAYKESLEELLFPREQVVQKPKQKRFPKGKNIHVLVVGDSLGEGLYLEYHKSLAKKFRCFKVDFLVRHSTTTIFWANNRRLFETLKREYDIILIVLGANEWKLDRISIKYNVKRFLNKLRKYSDADLYWVVPPVDNEFLRHAVESLLGSDKTIALKDFLQEIPLDRDGIHPSMRKRGYYKLWEIILETMFGEVGLPCQS